MQIPLDQSMDEYIQHMHEEAVIVRIADEFGKRLGGTNRLAQPGDYDPVWQEKWEKKFLERTFSGRPMERWAREHIKLHNANTPRYLKAMNNWVQAVSTLTLFDLTRKLNEELAPSLPSLLAK